MTMIVALALLGFIALIYFQQHALIYHPRPYDSSYEHALPAGAEELEYTLSFGRQVAFYIPPRASSRAPERIWVAFCGNGSLALDWTTILRGYPTETDAFLLVDYPGYGKCEGYATIASTTASADAALAALSKRLRLEPEQVEPLLCTIGHSLGAAAAFELATHHTVQRLVVVAPFTTLREQAAKIGGPLSYLLVESYDNRANLRRVLERNPATRVAIFHGTDDDLIPVRMGRELAQLDPQRVQFHPVAGADHVSVLTIAKRDIIEAMNR